MRIYITHCSATKNIKLKNTRIKVFPDKLYTAIPTQRFMNKCKTMGVDWAIFSDKYGIWFPNIKHTWYEKNPSAITITDQHFSWLLNDFNKKLQAYNEIWFYYNPGRFHRLYKSLLRKVKGEWKLKKFTHIKNIV